MSHEAQQTLKYTAAGGALFQIHVAVGPAYRTPFIVQSLSTSAIMMFPTLASVKSLNQEHLSDNVVAVWDPSDGRQVFRDGQSYCTRRCHAAADSSLSSVTRSLNTFFASPNNIMVLGYSKSSFLIPAKPGLKLRLITKTVRASSTCKIGMP